MHWCTDFPTLCTAATLFQVVCGDGQNTFFKPLSVQAGEAIQTCGEAEIAKQTGCEVDIARLTGREVNIQRRQVTKMKESGRGKGRGRVV